MHKLVSDLSTGIVSEVPLTDEEIAQQAADVAEELAKKPAEVRTKRNAMLAESDWTQVADSPVDTSVWATYRQALRDISQQDGFPLSVIWPEEP
ncbi:MAG: tail fiber assembly protein [bacterium]